MLQCSIIVLKFWVIIAVVGLVVTSSFGVVLISANDFTHLGTNYVKSSPTSLIENGTILNITENSKEFPYGPGYAHYYGEQIDFTISSYMTITGAWNATSRSIIWVSSINEVWAEIPFPVNSGGTLNQSLAPGSYALTYGGFPGDNIDIARSVELVSLNVRSVTSLDLKTGTVINAFSSHQTYSFNVTQECTVVGSFDALGPFSFSVFASNGIGIEYGGSHTGYSYSVSLSQPISAGNYTVAFNGGPFKLTSTVEVLNINQG